MPKLPEGYLRYESLGITVIMRKSTKLRRKIVDGLLHRDLVRAGAQGPYGPLRWFGFAFHGGESYYRA